MKIYPLASIQTTVQIRSSGQSFFSGNINCKIERKTLHRNRLARAKDDNSNFKSIIERNRIFPTRIRTVFCTLIFPYY